MRENVVSLSSLIQSYWAISHRCLCVWNTYGSDKCCEVTFHLPLWLSVCLQENAGHSDSVQTVHCSHFLWTHSSSSQTATSVCYSDLLVKMNFLQQHFGLRLFMCITKRPSPHPSPSPSAWFCPLLTAGSEWVTRWAPFQLSTPELRELETLLRHLRQERWQ